MAHARAAGEVEHEGYVLEDHPWHPPALQLGEDVIDQPGPRPFDAPGTASLRKILTGEPRRDHVGVARKVEVGRYVLDDGDRGEPRAQNQSSVSVLLAEKGRSGGRHVRDRARFRRCRRRSLRPSCPWSPGVETGFRTASRRNDDADPNAQPDASAAALAGPLPQAFESRRPPAPVCCSFRADQSGVLRPKRAGPPNVSCGTNRLSVGRTV